MSSSVSLSCSLPWHSKQLEAVLQDLGEGPEVAMLTDQLKALVVVNDNESLLIRQQKELLIDKIVQTATVIRQHRTLQREMALLAMQSKQAASESRARVVEDQTRLHQEQVVHEQTVVGALAGIGRANQATVEIAQSCMEMQQQEIARTKKNLGKAEQEIQAQKEQELALLAQSRCLSSALVNY